MNGHLEIVRRDAQTGEVLNTWSKKNLITFFGPDAVVRLLAPNVALGVNVQQENQIKSMRFGTDNTTPTRADTDLTAEAVVASDPVRIQLFDANRLVGAGNVEFVATLDSATGNGVTYREAALFTRGDDDDPLATNGAQPFARQVFPDQEKTAAVELEFRWRITLSV